MIKKKVTDDNKIRIEAKCPSCHKKKRIIVNESDYHDWQNGKLAQEAFPYLSDEDRELLITGICFDCWEEMFADDEDEDVDVEDCDVTADEKPEEAEEDEEKAIEPEDWKKVAEAIEDLVDDKFAAYLASDSPTAFSQSKEIPVEGGNCFVDIDFQPWNQQDHVAVQCDAEIELEDSVDVEENTISDLLDMLRVKLENKLKEFDFIEDFKYEKDIESPHAGILMTDFNDTRFEFEE